MRVRWANYVSEAFTVTNGVTQGSVLSPYLFSVYMDGLSDKLNNTDAGCCIGNLTINHIMYADDLCCFAASAGRLQDLLDVCSNYAKLHDNVFNCKKTVGMIFSSKGMYTFPSEHAHMGTTWVFGGQLGFVWANLLGPKWA